MLTQDIFLIKKLSDLFLLTKRGTQNASQSNGGKLRTEGTERKLEEICDSREMSFCSKSFKFLSRLSD